MILESNYGNRFAGVGVAAKASVANGKIIVCKHDSKLKKIGKTKRKASALDSSHVFGTENGSNASQTATKMEPISGEKQSTNGLINGYRFVLLRDAIFSFC